MANFRAKIIIDTNVNVQTKQDETISVSDGISIFREESVCDYNILIVDLPSVTGRAVYGLDKGEFYEFLSKPSIILCTSSEEDFYREYLGGRKYGEPISNYDWLPCKERFKLTNKKGESINPTSDCGRFSELFNDYDWEWWCIFSSILSTPPNYVSLADNISGQSVALRVDIGEGRIVILPTPKINISDSKKYSAFLRRLIDASREEIEEMTNKEREEPNWVEKYVVSEELELRDKIKKLQNEYQTLTEAHKLLYEMGKTLTKTVNSVLTDIGFNSNMREEEGTHDIEICEDDLNLVIEVTSSKDNWININKTRQLLDWCLRFETERGKKPKGILITNSYCNSELTERDEPFTKGALTQAQSAGFCLMTTEQLYNIFCKFFKAEIDKNEVIKLFLDTTGLLQIQ